MAIFGQLAYELASLRHCYPQFVLSSRSITQVAGDVPVFVFHTIEPQRFEAQLAYLADAGYRTISLDEFVSLALGNVRGTGKEVLLTIDDARSSVWRYGFPLLQRYQAKAALFAITGWTHNAKPRPTIEDAWSGRSSVEDIHALDPDDLSACSWDELNQMRTSGLVDVESHTHLHRKVFVERRLLSVVTRDCIRTASDAVFAPYLSPGVDPTLLSQDHYLGYPLFATAPLLAAPRAVEIAEPAAHAVRDAYMREYHGASPTRRQLRKWESLLPDSAFLRLSTEEVELAIRKDLAASQNALRNGLRDATVGRHLCLPFTAGSDVAVDVAKRLGYSTVFWGVSRTRRSNPPGSDLMRIVRLKNDFVWRLPSIHRRSLASIYLEKTSRRMAGLAPY